MNFKIVTSNPNKLAEFQRFGLNILAEKGKDLKEVDADPSSVVLYKALEAGKGCIVEDTSLDVEGMDIGVNVRWAIASLNSQEKKKATWRVLLGKNDGTTIFLFEGLIQGTLVNNEDDGFGFDPFFVPDGQEMTLKQLDALGKKDKYSARKLATHNLLQGLIIASALITSIPKWDGAYQNE